MKEPPPLPNVANWQPREKASDSLASAFARRCNAAEKRILAGASYEEEMNIDNFDSGNGVEDTVRLELAAVLPNRYALTRGVLSDRYGKTGGDYDIVIFNGQWTPQIKSGATPESRRIHLPIEGVYAVGEVKQTLSFKTLDAALEKLVIAHRLHRPPTGRTRVVENLELGGCRHGLRNPLFSFIVATRLAPEHSLDAIIRRFVEINQRLRRLEMVRALCVLSVGTVAWVYLSEDGQIYPSLLMDSDLNEALKIGLETATADASAFYTLARTLLLHLQHSVLAPEDIPAHYGPTTNGIKVPNSEELTHHAHARPNDDPSKPYDYEFSPFGHTHVGHELGAHADHDED